MEFLTSFDFFYFVEKGVSDHDLGIIAVFPIMFESSSWKTMSTYSSYVFACIFIRGLILMKCVFTG